MSKNLSFENGMKEDKNEEFLAFVKDYNRMQGKYYQYTGDREILSFSLALLLACEGLMYYFINDHVLKKMVMFGIGFMFVSCFGKTILAFYNGFLNRKQTKKDLEIINEKAQGWIEFYKLKENKVSLAQNLMVRLENIEKIKLEKTNTENIEKSIHKTKEHIYNLVKYEINTGEFDGIERLLTVMHNLETNVSALFKGEQEYKQIKNEIHAAITSNNSDTFKENKTSKSFS